MKLYTEEQVKQMIEKSRETGLTAEYLILTTPAIELPTDEEIDEYMKSFPYEKHRDDGQYNDGVIVGAELAIEWVINKLKGGEQ
jgi:hypothetical protein